MLKLAADTVKRLRGVVSRCIPYVREASFKLVTGRIDSSPFSGGDLQSARERWAALLDDPKDAMVIDEGQPFLLRGLAQWLLVFRDPDVQSLVDEDSFATGVPLGVDAPLPRSPQIYPAKTKHRKLDESEFNPIASNYPSAQVSSVELEAKFKEEEEEALGHMFPSRLSVLKQEIDEGRLRVISMAAIVKPDGSVRPRHDGTHSVRVNNKIICRDQLQCAAPPEVASVVLNQGKLHSAFLQI